MFSFDSTNISSTLLIRRDAHVDRWHRLALPSETLHGRSLPVRKAIVTLLLFQAANELTDDSVLLTFEDNLLDRKFSPFSKTNLRLSRQAKIELSPLRTISSSQYQRLIEVVPSQGLIDRDMLVSSRNLARISMIITR